STSRRSRSGERGRRRRGSLLGRRGGAVPGGLSRSRRCLRLDRIGLALQLPFEQLYGHLPDFADRIGQRRKARRVATELLVAEALQRGYGHERPVDVGDEFPVPRLRRLREGGI